MNGSMPTIGRREGRVEICYENEYYTICDDLWSVQDAQVICRQLNVDGNSKTHTALMNDGGIENLSHYVFQTIFLSVELVIDMEGGLEKYF